MKSRSRAALVGFVASAALLAAGLGALTAAALRSERSELEALQRSALEEDVRLALWRMDAAFAAFLAAENSRPVDRFLSSLPAASRSEEAPFLQRRFEVGAEGKLSGDGAGEAPDWLIHWAGEAVDERDPEPPPEPVAAPATYAASLPVPASASGSVGAPTPVSVGAEAAEAEVESEAEPEGDVLPPAQRDLGERQSPFAQSALNNLEYLQRAELNSQVSSLPPPPTQELPSNEPAQQESPPEPSSERDSPPELPPEPPAVERARVVAPPRTAQRARVPDAIRQPLIAHWVGDQLVLRRRVLANGRQREQITWLDWTRLDEFLLAQTREVFPRATLIPSVGQVPPDPGRLLALLPVRLDPGPVAPAEEVAPALGSPMGTALAVAWGAMGLALLGVGALLWGSVRLSRRREEFVSAVTHELRTPLTTFRLQSEMLAEGMVPDAERQGYAETLHRQADRLGHLVDNVLSFSRLEKGRWPVPPPTPLREVIEPVQALLDERAADSGLELLVDLAPEVLDTPVRADRERLERVLFNLVDNACKYAADSDPPRIEIRGERRGRRLVLAVRDHGRGVAKRQRRHLFRPFHKSAEHATGSAPGVGLGLSLARRLARGLGGDLVLSEVGAGSGAVFEFELPLG